MSCRPCLFLHCFRSINKNKLHYPAIHRFYYMASLMISFTIFFSRFLSAINCYMTVMISSFFPIISFSLEKAIYLIKNRWLYTFLCQNFLYITICIEQIQNFFLCSGVENSPLHSKHPAFSYSLSSNG